MEDRSGFVAGLIVGAMIGLGLGIMLAPRAGQETRDQLKEKAQAGTERLKATAADVGGRVRESAGDVASQVREKMDKDDILDRLGCDGLTASGPSHCRIRPRTCLGRPLRRP